MANPLPENQTSSLTDTENEDQQEKSNGERMSIGAIADLSGIDAKIVRKYLYTGIIGSTKKSDVLAWIAHKSKNVVARLPRVDHDRVFNKWR